MGAFTSGELAAWGVPFLELARRGRIDVRISMAPLWIVVVTPTQPAQVHEELQVMAQHDVWP